MSGPILKPIKHHKPDHSHPKRVPKHADHDHISKRHEKFFKAMIDNDIDAQMKFYSPSAVMVDMNHGTSGASAPYSEMRLIFERIKLEFTNVQYTTKSLHGTKHFTTWEYDCRLDNLISSKGEGLVAEKIAEPHALSGVALIWWNEDGKIERMHQYTVHRDAAAVQQAEEQEKERIAS